MQKNKTLAFDTKHVSEQGVVSGVLNHFGNKDHAGDITVKGAFRTSIKSLEKSGRDLVMLWQHDPDKPIGVWKNLRETERGLEGDGHINLETTLGKEAYALAKQGALSGISIGYWVVDEQYDHSSKTNYLKEVELRETSLVTFPCNEQSRIDGVKQMKVEQNGLPSVTELKEFLVTNGLEKEQAEAVCAKYLPDYVDPEEKARLEAEAKEKATAEIEALMKEAGLSMKEVADAIDGGDEVHTSDEEHKESEEEVEEKEEETEEEPEEKSNSLDNFFK